MQRLVRHRLRDDVAAAERAASARRLRRRRRCASSARSRHEDDLRDRVVFGLRQQIRGDEARIRRIHRRSPAPRRGRRADRWRRRRDRGDDLLGRGDPGAAGPEDLVDLAHGLACRRRARRWPARRPSCTPCRCRTVPRPRAPRRARLPSGPGELAMARAAQPAMRAGTASMMAVEGSGAEPAGTYRPTLSIGRVMRSQRTPGMVSTTSGGGDLRFVKARDVGDGAFERRDLRGASARRALRGIPPRSTRRSSSARRRTACVNRRTAASPSARTAAMIAAAWRNTSSRLPAAGRASAARRASGEAVFQSMIFIVRPASSRPAAPAARSRRPSSGSRAFPRTRSRGTPRGSPPCRSSLRAE